MFEIGDIVKYEIAGSTLYIVVDVIDFSTKKVAGSKNSVIDIDIEMMQIYPVRKTSKYITESYNNIRLHAYAKSEDTKVLLNRVIRERKARGWLGEPDFLEVVKMKLEDRKVLSEINSQVKKSRTSYSDNVFYNLLNVDECLDALNDLDILIEMFDDEEYINKRKVVLERLKFLTRE